MPRSGARAFLTSALLHVTILTACCLHRGAQYKSDDPDDRCAEARRGRFCTALQNYLDTVKPFLTDDLKAEGWANWEEDLERALASLKDMPNHDSTTYSAWRQGLTNKFRIVTGPSIESMNALPSSSYFQKFVPQQKFLIPEKQQPPGQNEELPTDRHNIDTSLLRMVRKTSHQMLYTQIDECLDLIADTSRDDYAESSMGWSRDKKRKEMRLPDLRYVLLYQAHADCADTDTIGGRGIITKLPEGKLRPARDLLGFMSFMLTYEDGYRVIYLYEIHFVAKMRGQSLGSGFMDIFEEAGRKAKVQKAMLTVFRVNEGALRFYKKRGYEEDEHSPQPRKLRCGTAYVPDYLIMSKDLRNDTSETTSRPKKRRRA